MDGTGYPKRLKREEMSLAARMMAIADIFEALTASDRPYKTGKTLSEALSIMAAMCHDAHIDPHLFALFMREQVFMQYARRFLDPRKSTRWMSTPCCSRPGLRLSSRSNARRSPPALQCPDLILLGEAANARAVQVQHANQAAVLDQRHDQLTVRSTVTGNVPGNACTSSTRWVCRVAAAAPHTPRPNGIRTQAICPWNGPSTSSSLRLR
jgi:hypothetical protein